MASFYVKFIFGLSLNMLIEFGLPVVFGVCTCDEERKNISNLLHNGKNFHVPHLFCVKLSE